MDFLKNSQTNWKFILVTAILATIVGGGILGLQWWMAKQEVSPGFLEIKKPEKFIEAKCEDIQGLAKQTKCYTNLAKEKKDESYCGKIPEAPEVRANCYSELAILKDDPSICWKIEYVSLASSCWEYFRDRKLYYRNEEYGFGIDYPVDWKLSDWELTQNQHHFRLQKSVCEDERCAIFYTCEFSISTSKDKPFEIKEPICYGQTVGGPHAPPVCYEDKEEISIKDKLSAKKFYNSEFPGSEFYFLKEKNDKGYYFKISTVVWEGGHDPVVAKEHKCGELFSQMLSTFQFLE